MANDIGASNGGVKEGLRRIPLEAWALQRYSDVAVILDIPANKYILRHRSAGLVVRFCDDRVLDDMLCSSNEPRNLDFRAPDTRSCLKWVVTGETSNLNGHTHTS